MAQGRYRRIKQEAQCEEHEVGCLATDEVRARSPEETTADVEQTQQTREAGCNRSNGLQLIGIELAEGQVEAQQFTGEDFLQQRRSHAQDTDTGRYVKAQHQPDQTELRCFPGHADVHVTVGDHRVLGLGSRSGPAFRFPAGWRNTVAQRTADHEDEVDHRHHHEALPYANAFSRSEVAHQSGSQRCAHHRAAAKAHDRHAGCHAALVREPLDQGRYRGDIAQPQTDTADHARAQPHQPDLVRINAQRGNQQATTPAEGRNHTRLAWTCVLQPATPNGSRATQEDEKQCVDPAQHGDLPVTGRREHLREKTHVRCASDRRRNTDSLRQRQPEYREAVSHTDTKMDGQCCRWNKPTVETWLGDNALFGQERRLNGCAAQGCACAHYNYPNV